MKEEILKEINRIIKIVSEVPVDYEVAHDCEDSLREDFIKFVAERNDYLGEMAKLVLTTNDLDFPRYSS